MLWGIVLKRLFLYFSFLASFVFYASSNALEFYEQGQNFQKTGDWYSAIESYKMALQENPSYNLVFQGLAECFYKIDEYDQALDYVKKALRYKKDSAELKNLEGFILIGLGDLQQAKNIFEDVLKTSPNDINSRFGLAEIEVSNGKLISATNLYKAALARQGENQKALLSLALLSFEAGNSTAVKSYISQALRYHGDNAAVHYFAAYISALENDNEEAEARVQTALKINPNMDVAKQLLATVLYNQRRYYEARLIANERISSNRNLQDAWYLKTLCDLNLQDYKGAIQSARVGLSIEPNNEIMRSLLETIAIKNLDFEDKFRKELAEYHEKKAKRFENLNNINSSIYEYRQALRVYPYNTECRFGYAKLLLRQGYYERALEQLEFIQSITKSDTRVNDAVESYGKILSTSLQNTWGVNPLYLSKGHISISLFYAENTTNVLHPESEKIATKMTSEIIEYNRRFNVSYDNSNPSTYAEAFRKARTQKSDFFGILRIDETQREIKLTLDLYVGRTGSLAKSFTVFRSGNNRYVNALLRIYDMINSSMPYISKVIKRNMSNILVDLGKNDGEFNDMEFLIIEDGKLSFQKNGIGLVFDQKNILGTFLPSKSEEDLTEGTFKQRGYYDRVNEKDWCIALTKDALPTTDLINTSNQEPIILNQLREIRKNN